jgi:hypothetical protein
MPAISVNFSYAQWPPGPNSPLPRASRIPAACRHLRLRLAAWLEPLWLEHDEAEVDEHKDGKTEKDAVDGGHGACLTHQGAKRTAGLPGRAMPEWKSLVGRRAIRRPDVSQGASPARYRGKS